VSLIVIKSDGD